MHRGTHACIGVARIYDWSPGLPTANAGPDFAGGGPCTRPRANIEDGSSLIIHWNSGSHKRSTNLANQYDIYFGGGLTGGDPLNPALC